MSLSATVKLPSASRNRFIDAAALPRRVLSGSEAGDDRALLPGSPALGRGNIVEL